ncbi:hypothetical protein D9M68_429450 [compost metagenome]
MYGNGALSKWNTSTHTACDRMVSTTADNSPIKPPAVAPRVVQPLHSTDMNSTGKLADAATANASDTMKAMFCFSNTMPSTTATRPRMIVVMRETRSSTELVACPFLKTVA